nr:hypothetical protein [uncultured Dethiosulfovibrio sp.]
MLSMLEDLHQNMSQVIILLRELQRYEGDFTPAKKAEFQAEKNRLLGDAQLKMDTIEDHRANGTWKASSGS